MNNPSPLPEIQIPSLHSRAMLAYICCSAWSARKLDRKATTKVTEAAGATSEAGRFNKHLLANADESLKRITKIGADARRYLESNSLPWDDAGNRLISNDKALEVVGRVQQMIREHNEAVEDFVKEYPALRAQALHNLGELANDEDYPQPDIVRGKFDLRLSLNPMPSGFGDVRMGLNEAQVKALQAQFEARVRMQYHVAIGDAWRRLRENVQAVAERMGIDEKTGKRKIFRDSLFDNIRETCSLLKSLNVFDDPQLNQVRFEVEQYLGNLEGDQVRGTDAIAAATKMHAESILRQMQDILGE